MPSSHSLFSLQPDWQRRECIRAARIPLPLHTWLYNDASLTARLKSSCGKNFRVKILKQRYARILLNEERTLNIPHRQFALLREVFLYCADTPVVYARSVIPLSTLTGKQSRLAHLGNKPLGGFLFSCPSMRREAIELAELLPGDPVYNQAMRHNQHANKPVWGRRSVFRLAGKPLLVAEIFLPSIIGIKP